MYQCSLEKVITSFDDFLVTDCTSSSQQTAQLIQLHVCSRQRSWWITIEYLFCTVFQVVHKIASMTSWCCLLACIACICRVCLGSVYTDAEWDYCVSWAWAAALYHELVLKTISDPTVKCVLITVLLAVVCVSFNNNITVWQMSICRKYFKFLTSVRNREC